MSTDWKAAAVKLIKQLPETHEGRNTFIMNNSNCDEAKKFKVEHVLRRTDTSLEEKVDQIQKVYEVKDSCGSHQPMNQAPQYPRQQPNW